MTEGNHGKLVVSVVTLKDDLDRLVREINSAQWDDANDISHYDVHSLSAYLSGQDNLFVTCHELQPDGRVLMGIASSRFQLKPYDQERWLYVDEVDVCVDQRQKGAGKAIMQKLIELADENDCEEVWLGTEPDNTPANALYRSLNPEEEETFIGYTFDPDS